MDLRKQLENEFETVRTLRDELRLQLHLGTQEAQDAFHALEKKWGQLEGHAKVIVDASRESLEDIDAAWQNLTKELRDGYRSVKQLF